jgi:hypothetical protein
MRRHINIIFRSPNKRLKISGKKTVENQHPKDGIGYGMNRKYPSSVWQVY